MEEILLVSECGQGVVVVTDTKVKLLSADLQATLGCLNFVQSMSSYITVCSLQQDLLVLALDDGTICGYDLSQGSFGALFSINTGFEVASIALTEDKTLMCVGLLDAPLYSLDFYRLGGEQPLKVDSRSMLAVLEHEVYEQIVCNA